MQKSLAAFSLALTLKVRILDIPKLEKCERTLDITKPLRKAERLEK